MKRRIISLILVLAFLVSLLPIQSMAITLNTDNTETQTLKVGVDDGYHYELWSRSFGASSMTLGNGGTYSCEWHCEDNTLFRKGMKFDGTRSHSQIGTISVEYDVDYKPEGNSYFSVYGFVDNSGTTIEYYIMDNWGLWRPSYDYYNSYTYVINKGKIKVDGGVYDVFEIPYPENNFVQYVSVRETKRTSGTISASEHFNAWEELGMNMSGGMKEVALTVEAMGGKGSADITKNILRINGAEIGNTDNLPLPTINSAGDIKYNYNSMLYDRQDGVTHSIDSSGALTANFDGQYKEVRYVLRNDLKLTDFKSIEVNAVSTSGQIAVKFYDDVGSEAFVIWNIKTTDVQDIIYNLGTIDKSKTIKYIGIMSQDDIESYSATINSITFINSAVISTLSPTPIPTFTPAATPTVTIMPTNTPTATPTVTIMPTNTPTVTIMPTNTPNNISLNIAPNVLDVKMPQKNLYIVKGKSIRVPAIAYTSTSNDSSLKWKSNKPSIVSVTQNGIVKGKKVGSAKITTSAPNGKKTSLNVYVVRNVTPVKSIIISEKALKKIKVGEFRFLNVSISPKKATGRTGAVISWKSSNKKIAKVDAVGKLTAVKKGDCKLTVTVGDKKKTLRITVK